MMATARISPPAPGAPSWVRLLLAIRWQRGWTQQQLADELGVHPMTVSCWERGKHEPHPTWMQILRRLLAD